jgi:hypothetical protein
MLLPEPAGAGLTRAGLLSVAQGGYGPAVFADSDGRFLVALMQRIDTPIASRWGQILLRRALLSKALPPRRVRPADWLAERALLLARLGEIDSAHRLLDQVPADAYTVRLLDAAAYVYLAAGDIPALCPLDDVALTVRPTRAWRLIGATCAGIEGDDILAASALDQLRSDAPIANFDLLLAERLATATAGGGRAANVEWSEAGGLSAYRFGMASAVASTIPDALIAASQPRYSAWLARSPTASADQRSLASRRAASIGVLSGRELVQIESARGAELGLEDPQSDPALLRTAYVGRSLADRLEAIEALWAKAEDPVSRYGALILTSDAAARIPPSADMAEKAPALIQSMLATGRVDAARRWAPVLEQAGGDAWARAWPLLAIASAPEDPIASAANFRAWHERERRDAMEADERARLLFGLLSGLGKTASGEWDGLRDDLALAPAANEWTARLDAAAAAGRKGETALLVATGMQGPWPTVEPAHVERMLAALGQVQLAGEARMMAAEAWTRR